MTANVVERFLVQNIAETRLHVKSITCDDTGDATETNEPDVINFQLKDSCAECSKESKK